MATAAQLAQRRAIVAASRQRHPLRAMPRAQLPRGPQTQYTAALLTIADELDAAILAALAAEGLPVPRRDAGADGAAAVPRRDAGADGAAAVPPFDRASLWKRLKRIAASLVRSRGGFMDRTLAAVGKSVASFSKVQFSTAAKAAMGIDLSEVEPTLTPVIASFRTSNLALIKTMAADKIARVRAILDDAPSARVETIRDRLIAEQGVGRRHAALIARDQVLKLNASVTESRHAAAGIVEYHWRTSGDGDVRAAHRALDGRRFRYDDPPVVTPPGAKKERREHPGMDYQCRCTAEPILPLLDPPTLPGVS